MWYKLKHMCGTEVVSVVVEKLDVALRLAACGRHVAVALLLAGELVWHR